MFKKEKTAKVQDANSFWAEQRSKRVVNLSKFQSVYNQPTPY